MARPAASHRAARRNAKVRRPPRRLLAKAAAAFAPVAGAARKGREPKGEI